MAQAGALCPCGSHDVRLSDPTCIGRMQFRCGTCGAQWTAGNDGMPYAEFAKGYMPDRSNESEKPAKV